jgi:hypothetical protein
MQSILNELEISLRRRDNNEYLKKSIIILHDVFRINPAEDMTKTQTKVLLDVCEQVKSNRNNLDRDKFLKIYESIIITDLYILPVTSKVIKNIEEVFNETAEK